MENRITFFRFNATNTKYSGGLRPSISDYDLGEIKKLEKRIEDLKWNNRLLERNEALEVRFREFLKNEMQQIELEDGRFDDRQELLEDIIDFVGTKTREERDWTAYLSWVDTKSGREKKSDLPWRLYYHYDLIEGRIQNIEREFDMHEVHAAFYYASVQEEISKLRATIDKHETNLLQKSSNKIRISEDDINNLNSETERMNKEGWEIKQVEGINSGMFNYDTSFSESAYGVGGAGYGYGFSYTEGVMVVWEKR